MTRKERAAYLMERQMEAIRKHLERLALARLKALAPTISPLGTVTPSQLREERRPPSQPREERRPRGVSGMRGGGGGSPAPASRHNRSAVSIAASQSPGLPLASPLGSNCVERGERLERLERAHNVFSAAAVSKAAADCNVGCEHFGADIRSTGAGGFKPIGFASPVHHGRPVSRGRAGVGRPATGLAHSQSLPQLVSCRQLAGKTSYLTTGCTLVRG